MKDKKLKYVTQLMFAIMLFHFSANVFAQTIAENVLDDIVISKSDFTGIVKVKFKIPVRYVSHSPKNSTKEIRIKVDLLSKINQSMTNDEFGFRESLVPQYKHSFGLQEVMYETVGRDNYVTLLFDNDVSFEIIQDSSYRSLSILLHGVK